MSHPSKREEEIDGIKIKVSSFKSNWWIYKSIGGEVKIRGEKKIRKWWCAWLCKREVEVKAEIIEIQNTYFTRLDNSAILVQSASHNKACNNSANCKLRHFAVGIGVKIKFPGGSTSPGLPSDLLPLNGVISRTRVRVNGREFNFVTAKGAHPEVVID